MNKRVLLVEDDEILRDTLMDILADAPYQIDGGAQQELVNDLRTTPYDLLLIDLMIKPVEDEAQVPTNIHFEGINWRQTGVELIRRIRRGDYAEAGTRADVPIIVITARGDKSLKQQLDTTLKVAMTFEKPYKNSEVCRKIEDLLQDQT